MASSHVITALLVSLAWLIVIPAILPVSTSQVSQFEDDWGAHSTAAWLAVAYVPQVLIHWTSSSHPTRSLYTFTAAYGVSYGPIGRTRCPFPLQYLLTPCCFSGWVLPSEVFPLSMRSKGVSLSTASVWVNNCSFFNLVNYIRSHWYLFVAVLIGLVTPALMEISASFVLLLISSKTWLSDLLFWTVEHSWSSRSLAQRVISGQRI